jgi:hypothetical protein
MAGKGIILIAILSLILAIGGSVLSSIIVANQTKQSICYGFNSVIKAPTAQPGSILYRREQENYNNLLIFEHRIGCH